MNATVLKTLVAAAVVGPMVVWSLRRLRRAPGLGTRMQAAGAFGLVVVVIAHLCEGLRVFPRIGWGEPHSLGHYLDLSGAVVGLALVPAGYLLSRRRSGAT